MLSDESCPDFFAVEPELHSVETFLDDSAGVVRNASAGICHHLGFCVLDHHHTVPVINIGYCVSVGRQCVEEKFLAPQIFCERLVIVEVVVGEVREYSDFEFQSCHALLLHSDGTYFHEAVVASLVNHLSHKGVDCDRVGCRVGRFKTSVSHIVGDCGKQSALVAEAFEHIVQQGYRSCFAVRAGNSHQCQFVRRISVEFCSRHCFRAA